MLAGCVAGCAGIPEEAYRLPSSPGVREAQTRTFEVPDETSILQVAVALMQDMEYNFDTISMSSVSSAARKSWTPTPWRSRRADHCRYCAGDAVRGDRHQPRRWRVCRRG